MGDVQYRGGFADVLKCECGDRTVAVKALRPHDGLSLEDMRNVSHHWLRCIPVHIDELSISFAEVLQGGHNLEISSTSECVAPSGGDHDRDPICHGF